MKSPVFKPDQREAQIRFFSQIDPANLMEGYPYRLIDRARSLNLNPVFSEDIEQHFAGDAARNGSTIVWHQHSNHALSSQVCCVNFLAPLMRQPELLSRVLASALGVEPPEMQPVGTDAKGRDLFVDFEWTGESDYLGEWPKGKIASRGANATSADAAVRYRDSSGLCTVLIEWKYTESYGAPIPDSANPEGGNRTRVKRYQDKTFEPDGPIRSDLGLTVEDFFWEPFYQLVRQQMLAWRMQQARESGADRVMVLHISPKGNLALHKVTAPNLQRFGSDAFEVFSRLLVEPGNFRSASIEAAFLPTLQKAAVDGLGREWATYLLERYTFLRDHDQ
ncbi:PGN_0703 family putative restriction endonuclease [Cypionkella sinensis]|uniref:Restriction endonuclease n=1 Tax=Cypionkella sinensis TaxID=1756043 RepID=A0ABV7J7I8_9RHOB